MSASPKLITGGAEVHHTGRCRFPLCGANHKSTSPMLCCVSALSLIQITLWFFRDFDDLWRFVEHLFCVNLCFCVRPESASPKLITGGTGVHHTGRCRFPLCGANHKSTSPMLCCVSALSLIQITLWFFRDFDDLWRFVEHLFCVNLCFCVRPKLSPKLRFCCSPTNM